MIELAKVGRISITTEDFWLALELTMTQVLYHPQQSRARTTGMLAQLGCAYDKVACAIVEFYRDREFSITTDLDRA